MRTFLAVLLLSAGLLALAAPASGATLRVNESLESAVVKRINAVRRSHGLRRLRLEPRLTKAADRHAVSMGRSGYFSHDLFTPRRSPRWSLFGRWIRWFYPGPGHRSWSAGENLAWGAPRITARQTVRAWLRSPGHRANLLKRSWRNVGVAAVVVRDPRRYFRAWDDVTIVAAEFGRRYSR
ncbi:MAG TPA: CAP domain-containing protein [Gaiellaceae bacterium]|nr:CAP domain-containing protein [Gaiellaceae bacterium]